MHYNHDIRKIGAQNAEEIIDIANNYHETEENSQQTQKVYISTELGGYGV